MMTKKNKTRFVGAALSIEIRSVSNTEHSGSITRVALLISRFPQQEKSGGQMGKKTQEIRYIQSLRRTDRGSRFSDDIKMIKSKKPQ